MMSPIARSFTARVCCRAIPAPWFASVGEPAFGFFFAVMRFSFKDGSDNQAAPRAPPAPVRTVTSPAGSDQGNRAWNSGFSLAQPLAEHRRASRQPRRDATSRGTSSPCGTPEPVEAARQATVDAGPFRQDMAVRVRAPEVVRWHGGGPRDRRRVREAGLLVQGQP